MPRNPRDSRLARIRLEVDNSRRPEAGPARDARLPLGLCLLIWAGAAILAWGAVVLVLRFI
jgi:hypothetical protein